MYFQYGQDSYSINDVNLSPFRIEKGDIKYVKAQDKDVFDFVGFILDDKHVLSVFPKHFYNVEELKYLNKHEQRNMEDIKLLFDVLIRYMKESETTAKASKYVGNNPVFVSDYPFAAFYEVYRYFCQYGIYRESHVDVKANANGAISWKKTIQKAEMIVSDGNLIFIPLYRKKKRQHHVFLSECMAFVIDHTIDSFRYFLQLPRTGHPNGAFDFLKYREYTLQQLHQINSKTFKDNHKKLIAHLIRFFEEYQKSPKGGNIHIKINYFDRIWENMVSNYLNKYFKCVDEETNSIIFDKSQPVASLEFNNEEFAIDDSPNEFNIRLDHYAKKDDSIYIFDSKYYYSVLDLNYKQFSYNEMLRGGILKGTKIYSALILPDNISDLNLHFSLSQDYLGGRETGTKIIEQYLNIKEVMQVYLSK